MEKPIPGKTYRIKVRDCDNHAVYKTYTLPSPSRIIYAPMPSKKLSISSS